jgi:6-phosphogluconolactonase
MSNRVASPTLPESMAATRWHAYSAREAFESEACRRILDAARAALAERGAFHVVLAGGDTPRGVYARLRAADTDWTGWHVYFGDERCLPAGDPARNDSMARQAWLAHVPIPPGQCHAMSAELGPEAAAGRYAALLRDIDRFDLVLLGLGQDGHTASLFPGHTWAGHSDWPDVLTVHDAPKPPAERVTLSPKRLARTRACLFLVAGADKAAAVAAWRAGADIPAARIAPDAGVDILTLGLDTAAAAEPKHQGDRHATA